MKKLCAVTFVSVLLLISIACSSIPKGTEAINQLQKNAAARIGQNVTVVGMAETKTPMASSSFKMFQVYQDNDSIWVRFSQGRKCRRRELMSGFQAPCSRSNLASSDKSIT